MEGRERRLFRLVRSSRIDAYRVPPVETDTVLGRGLRVWALFVVQSSHGVVVERNAVAVEYVSIPRNVSRRTSKSEFRRRRTFLSLHAGFTTGLTPLVDSTWYTWYVVSIRVRFGGHQDYQTLSLRLSRQTPTRNSFIIWRYACALWHRIACYYYDQPVFTCPRGHPRTEQYTGGESSRHRLGPRGSPSHWLGSRQCVLLLESPDDDSVPCILTHSRIHAFTHSRIHAFTHPHTTGRDCSVRSRRCRPRRAQRRVRLSERVHCRHHQSRLSARVGIPRDVRIDQCVEALWVLQLDRSTQS